MRISLKSALASAALILIGAGCASAPPVQELPTTPPSAAELQAENIQPPVPDETQEAMEKKDDVAMMKKDEGTMEKSGEAQAVQTNPLYEEKAMTGENPMFEETKMMKPEMKPYYIAYTDAGAAAALSEGRATLLYFFAAWCPICRAEDPNIKSWVEGSDLPVAGFRVDYDKESALKAKYKIPYQHTTVILNTKGEETKRFSGPVTQTELIAALTAAAK